MPGLGGVGGDGAGQVAGRGAGEGVEAELERLAERDETTRSLNERSG